MSIACGSSISHSAMTPPETRYISTGRSRYIASTHPSRYIASGPARSREDGHRSDGVIAFLDEGDERAIGREHGDHSRLQPLRREALTERQPARVLLVRAPDRERPRRNV